GPDRPRSPAPPATPGLAWEVVIDGGRVGTGLDAVAWAQEGCARGAGEILLNSIDRDGTKLGFDLEMTSAIAAVVDVPVIASGGASSADDFVTLFRQTPADAGLAASIFHYRELTIPDVKAAIANAGIRVRPAEAFRSSQAAPPPSTPGPRSR
ncbi:MAG: hypothetical protein HYY42_00350, partial [Chloroflexi bacterium]|nr:hypothetical protein [Chloroflexota bacterium]